MSMPLTLISLAAAIGLTVFAGWRGARPWRPGMRVRMAPWRLIMLLAATAVFLLVIHVAALLGAPQRTF